MRIEQCNNEQYFNEEINATYPLNNTNQELKDVPSRFLSLGSVAFCGSGATSRVYKISGEHEYALKVVECGNSESKYKNALYEFSATTHPGIPYHRSTIYFLPTALLKGLPVSRPEYISHNNS